MNLFLAALINLVWAASYPISKRVLVDYPYESLTLLRIGLAGLFFLPILLVSPRMQKPSGRDATLFFLMGTVGCVLSTGLQYAGTALSLASHIALITSLETAVLVLLSAILLKDRLGREHLVSLGLSLAGIWLITARGGPTEDAAATADIWAGNGLMVLSVVCYALYTIFGKVLSQLWDSIRVTAIPFLVSAPLLAVALWLKDSDELSQTFRLLFVERLHLGAILFLSVVATTMTYWLWNWLLARMSARDLGYSLLVQTAGGPLFSFAFGGETISWSYVFGAGLIGVALWIVLPKPVSSG